jgi:hypothetical protein
MKSNLFCYFIALLIIFISSSCSKDTTSKYQCCDRDLFDICDGRGIGAFCTFGFKWGSNNPFSKPGLEKPGPNSGNVDLTYRFIDAGFEFGTHSQENLTSLAFENNTCASTKEKFRLAFTEWSSVAKINFREATAYENVDIKIIIADISQSSVGYTNFNKKPCSEIKGQIVFKKNEYSCSSIYGAILHEIGHVLGLGHVNSLNVMHPSQSTTYTNLQSGDILGVQSIYGAR